MVDKALYSGAFAYTSPPPKVVMSTEMRSSGTEGLGIGGAEMEDETPFVSKFSILNFSDGKKGKQNHSAQAQKMPKLVSGEKKEHLNVFKMC